MSTSILVIDANREFGILIRQSLEDAGDYRVTLTSDGAEAVDRAKVERFDLALIDLDLPDLPPHELIEQLRSARPDLPIVVIPRAQGDPTHLATLGVQGVLTKPFYLPNLPGMLGQILKGRTGRAWGARSAEPPTLEPEPAAEPEHPRKSVTGPIGPAAPFSDADLLARLEMTETAAAILIGDDGLVAVAGLGPTGADEAASILIDRGPDQDPGAAVAHYVRLSGAVQDYLLYGIRLESGHVLGAFFPSEAPFGVVRRSAHELATLLADLPVVAAGIAATARIAETDDLGSEPIEVPAPPIETVGELEPAQTAEIAAEATIEATVEETIEEAVEETVEGTTELPSELEQVAETEPEPPSLEPEPAAAAAAQPAAPPPAEPVPYGPVAFPADWLPGGPTTSGQAALFDALAEPEQPQAPAATIAPAKPAIEVTFPSDWVPAQPPAEAYLPDDVLADGAVPCADDGDEDGVDGSAGLTYSILLMPRFPEHRLAGAFARLLRSWTERFALAWDWHLHRLQISDTHLLLYLSLPGDVAPASACGRLRDHLSQQIMRRFPTLARELPSGRFWAPQEWISSGPPPSQSRISQWVDETRRSQGVPD